METAVKVIGSLVLSLLASSTLVGAVPDKPAAKKPAPKAEEKPEKKGGWSSDTWAGLGLRPIGPALTSGRIVDIAVDPTNSHRWFLAVASGGVWKTENAGTSFSPVFDGEGSYSIGCVALDPQDPFVVWVGTGENNSQRSVGYGDGVYRSADGGKSWSKVGLEKSEHIGKILIHPKDPGTVFVAAQGPLWAAGGDRGLYKTTDAGKTWQAVSQVPASTCSAKGSVSTVASRRGSLTRSASRPANTSAASTTRSPECLMRTRSVGATVARSPSSCEMVTCHTPHAASFVALPWSTPPPDQVPVASQSSYAVSHTSSHPITVVASHMSGRHSRLGG